MTASVLCLPPVLRCHSLCRTSSPPLWTANRILDLTGHLKKRIRNSSYSCSCEKQYLFFTMHSFLSQKELSESNTIHLVSMDALEEKTELSIFFFNRA